MQIEDYGFPFESVETEDGIGDRGASAADWAKYVSSIFTDGYILTPTDALKGFKPLEVTVQSGMTVSVGKGIIFICGRMKVYGQPVLVTLDQADAQPRIDLICLRLNLNAEERRIYPVVIKGTPSSTPPQPSYIRDDLIYDMIVAKVLVPANVAKLTQNDITDTRNDTGYCGRSITSDASELKPLITSAQTKADSAYTLADTANKAAGTAQGTANSAYNLANTANTAAYNAQVTANNAVAGLTAAKSGSFVAITVNPSNSLVSTLVGFVPTVSIYRYSIAGALQIAFGNFTFAITGSNVGDVIAFR